MKKILIAIVIIILAGVGYVASKSIRKNTEFTQLPSPTATQPGKTQFCTPTQLKTVMTPEAAAGNVYAKLSIKNTSATVCQIIGDNQLKVDYPVSVTNFRTDQKDTPQKKFFTLNPGQVIYSLIHYPNGPQCSSKATDVDTMVSYKISAKDFVAFTPANATTVSIPSCGEQSELTMIDLYSFADKEVLPH